jgi:hypothetical protein
MDDGRGVIACDIGDQSAQREAETRTPPKGADLDAFCLHAWRPRSSVVQTADHHRNLGVKSGHQLRDEPLGAPGIQAEGHLQYAGLANHVLHNVIAFRQPVASRFHRAP